MINLTCFKAYDVRGKIGVDLDETIARAIGYAFATVLRPRTVVLGHDCRPTSANLRDALAAGLTAQGVKVLDIGLAGTEEVYFATSHLEADGGIEVTASHNPIGDNGMKFVGCESRPLSEDQFDALKVATAKAMQSEISTSVNSESVSVRDVFADHLVSLVDPKHLPELKIVANAGNGVAGPAFDAIIDRLQSQGAKLEVIRVNHAPDPSFPNGIPNPLLPENRSATASVVTAENADLGIAWDGDFDRCFFFDHTGAFVDGEYIVGLLASAFLATLPGETIVHDPRVIWNTQDQIERHGGVAQVSRTGHAHIKRTMREVNAVYGGEMSAHHYFRDFMFCDSGMLPWLKVIALMGQTGKSLAALVSEMQARFPSSGEINFTIPNPAGAIAKVEAAFEDEALKVEHFDGLSMAFDNWRFNLRSSSTEPLVRLNVETRGDAALLKERTEALSEMLRDASA
ncbi:phosphomannomutase [Yoonia litorea]|uniref:Phosphomannomutase n=1 Tax=Yoonia litorea TaxID=1123755 RepID=A0A1I6M7E0_9RHOB|nr:phosphomannomutase [Yoonia litorea]SFS11432.1 phosphomannomutase [Yoonia litorea]